MPALRILAAVAGALAVTCSLAHAQDIAVRVPPACEAAVADFDTRVRSALVARPASERHARVVIERRGKEYRVTIQAREANADLGTKRLSTASCDEAVAAAIAVLALALSDTATADEGDERGTRTPAADREVAVAVSDPSAPHAADGGGAVAPAEPMRGVARGGGDLNGHRAAASGSGVARVESRRESARHRHVHLALRAGVDAGTLLVPTGYLGAAATWLAGPLEWRALLGFALPYQEQELDQGREELRQGQFAWLDLGGCYGFGTAWRIAACAAGELSVIHHSRRVDGQMQGGTAGRLSGVLAAHLAYRENRLQPELELAAIAAPDGSRAVFRASFGLGMPF